MASYAFVTVWRFDVAKESIWNALLRSEDWPKWWPYVLAVEQRAPGDVSGIGAVHRYTWKSPLWYTLEFEIRATRIEEPVLLEGLASGDVQGMGRWHLSQEAGVTSVRYDWDVHTTPAWINAVSDLGRPVFRWSHDRVMRAGGEGLARWVGGRLLEIEAI